jgi:acyl-CoA dehydrogenase
VTRVKFRYAQRISLHPHLSLEHQTSSRETGFSMIDFAHPPELEALRARLREFIDTTVIPREVEVTANPLLLESVRAELQVQGRAAGLFLPHMPVAYGGLGLRWTDLAVVLEEAGRSLLGPQALNAGAPDEGNMHLLAHVANEAQKREYLEPLCRGETRSCFAMTEPAPGAGSDPNMLQASAAQIDPAEGDGWSINAHKWYTTGADGAAFALVLVRTQEGPTIFIVPAGHPGFTIKRRLSTLDHLAPGGHCELEFVNCKVGPEHVLGEPGKGFEYAALRLDPARLTHCMRWLGVAVRSIEIAIEYANRRSSFGSRLAEHQMVQAMIADSQIEIHASRLMILQAAWKLDRGERVRHEASMAKVFVSETVDRVVDRAVQICGGLGICDDLPLVAFYKESRPFRIYDGPNEVHRMSIAKRVLKAAMKD